MRRETDICIIGGGPAGSVLATRLAQLGHDVCLIERAVFPRRHLGESLSAGVLPLLAAAGARDLIANAGFTPVRTVAVDWDQGPQRRDDPAAQGLLVDRGRFDELLLDHARSAGVRVFQPATVAQRIRRADHWSLKVVSGDGTLELKSAFLADATGRAALLRARRGPTGKRTVALHAYWQGRDLPLLPQIKAGPAEWFWGVPLPDGVYNTLVFVDADRLRANRARLLGAGFQQLLGRSGLLAGSPDARLVSRVFATDATPYLDEESVTPHSIKVGDAAVSVDPLSSSGVQKAIQTALAGAVVVNTLLRQPEATEAALRFYRGRLQAASEQHRQWAAGHYRTVSVQRPGKFWQDRAAAIPPSPPQRASRESTDEISHGEIPLVVSAALEFVDLPCIEGEFVRVKAAIRHPALEEPVAYLGNWGIAPLLQHMRPGMTPQQMARAWAPRVPPDAGHAIVRWLVGHGLLVPQKAAGQPSRPAQRRSAA